MTRHLVLGLILILGSSAGVRAQDRTQATVVYDVNLREFVCWREGALVAAARAQPCNPSYGWHPVSSELYFTRGEAISVLLVNAVALNLFALDVKADDLPEPTTPIQGALSELPKLVPS